MNYWLWVCDCRLNISMYWAAEWWKWKGDVVVLWQLTGVYWNKLDIFKYRACAACVEKSEWYMFESETQCGKHLQVPFPKSFTPTFPGLSHVTLTFSYVKAKLSPKFNQGFFCECTRVKPSYKSIITMKEALLTFTVFSFLGQTHFQWNARGISMIAIFKTLRRFD